jgi:hypothetical protein
MKLYMVEYDMTKILKKIKTISKKYPPNKTNNEIFYSEQGMYQVIINDIFKLNVENELSQRFEENGVKWILDKSVLWREKVYQISVEHIKINLILYVFSLESNSKVKFIIEFLEKEENNENEKDIIDYYFDISGSDIPWQEINVFLSMLN